MHKNIIQKTPTDLTFRLDVATAHTIPEQELNNSNKWLLLWVPSISLQLIGEVVAISWSLASRWSEQSWRRSFDWWRRRLGVDYLDLKLSFHLSSLGGQDKGHRLASLLEGVEYCQKTGHLVPHFYLRFWKKWEFVRSSQIHILPQGMIIQFKTWSTKEYWL